MSLRALIYQGAVISSLIVGQASRLSINSSINQSANHGRGVLQYAFLWADTRSAPTNLTSIFFLLHYILYTRYLFIIILHICPKFLQTFKKILFIFKNKNGNGLSLLKPLPF